jgi:hypothetical protein
LKGALAQADLRQTSGRPQADLRQTPTIFEPMKKPKRGPKDILTKVEKTSKGRPKDFFAYNLKNF